MKFKGRMLVLRSSLKNRFLQVSLFGLILAGVAALLTPIAPSKAQEPQPIDGKHISFLVEQGSVLPSQPLASATSDQSNRLILTEPVRLPEGIETNSSFNVTFTISGNARFDSNQGIIAVTKAENGTIMTPLIVAGPAFGESFINVMVDGRAVVENLRVATLETAGIENLKNYIGADDPGVLVLSDHYAVLDETKMRVTTQAVTGRMEIPAEKDGNALSNQVTSKNDEQNTIYGLCIRSPFGPGWVRWHWSSSNPWATNGWAYKPESLSVVYRADDLANDAIDGLYKVSWGCGTAYKVPDSCTVDVYQGDSNIYYCCNAAAWAAGHRVGFVSSSALANPPPPCPW